MKTPSFSHASPATGKGSVGNMVVKLTASELVGSNVTVDVMVVIVVVSL